MQKFKSFLLLLFLFLPTGVFAQSASEEAFSPNQGATALIIKTIGEARQSIHVAAYSFTSKPIAKALVDAQQRGIDVQVVLDKSQRKARHSLLRYFRTHGIPARVNTHYAIMHNKFIIIDGKVLELGSFNYTKAAESKNAENVLVIRGDEATTSRYEAQWQKLWDEADNSNSTSRSAP